MRPESLIVEGFTAFRDRTEVDFVGADLFAFSGPTGAGKSSLIDAMIFALYGSVPRLANKNLVAPVISQQAVEAKVLFRFAIGGTSYTAVRVVRADTKGGATTKEARLEATRDDGQEVLAGDADGVTKAVTELLGLTYEHFTTCVVLPQGEFAKFLHNTPKDRQELLVRLLDLGIYARMGALANTRASVAKTERELVAARLGELADRTPAQRTELADRLGQLTGLVAAIDATRPHQDALIDRHDLAGRAVAEAERAVELLAAVAPPKGVDQLARRRETAVAALAAATEASAAAEAQHETAQAAHGTLPAAAEVRQLLDAHKQLAAVGERIAKGHAVVAAASAAAADAAAELAAAEAAVSAAELALDHARSADLVAAVTEGLKVGDPCPVCGEPLTALPKVSANALAKARKAVDAAMASRTRAQSRAADAAGAKTRATTLLEQLHEQQVGFAARVEGVDPPEMLTARLAEIDRAETSLSAARAAVADTRRARDEAKRDVAATDDDVQDGWHRFDDSRDKLAALEPPRPERTDLAAAWRALADWAQTQLPRHRQAAEEGRAEQAAARTELETLVAKWQAAAVDAGVVVGTKVVRDAVVEARSRAEAQLDQLDRDLAQRATLEAQLASATVTEHVAASAARYLRSDQFQKWLLDEALARLVVTASATLHQLSSGAYSLVPGKTGFDVVDHRNADLVRSVRTLSGGETFLASLSLALALADQVVDLAAGGGARLESIFLDEGFGTLDPETLEVVASAIEELGSNGRMVGIVSHVRDLAERLPVRFEVRKDATTSTVTRVGG